MSHPLRERLTDASPAERRAACRAVPDDPSAVLLLEAVGEALGDSDAGVRRAAGDALVALGRRHPEVDPLLLAALRADGAPRRFEAARALAALAPPAPRLIPALVEALGSAEQEIAWEAARLLVDTGRMHAEVVPIVTGLVHAGPSAGARRMAIFCLGKLAPERPETGEALLAASRSEEPALRRAAVSALPALARSGNACEAVASRLAEAAGSDPDPAVRALAERARTLGGQSEPDGERP